MYDTGAFAAPSPFYGNAPLGTLQNEQHLRVPYNATAQDCVVRVRNLSATIKRTVIEEAISIRRGGERAITEGPFKHLKTSGVEALRHRVAQGEDLNWTKEIVAPVNFVITHGGRKWLIPHTDAKTGDLAPWVVVDSGAWDLYMGNWERTHSPDQRERNSEMARREGRGLAKFVASPENKYGFLEFDRQVMQTQDVPVDKLALAAGTIIEV